MIAKQVQLPAGYYVNWSGQYENQQRARARRHRRLPHGDDDAVRQTECGWIPVRLWLEVDLQLADERWLTRLLLRLTPYAEVVAPASYGEAFTAAVLDALRLYR